MNLTAILNLKFGAFFLGFLILLAYNIYFNWEASVGLVYKISSIYSQDDPASRIEKFRQNHKRIVTSLSPPKFTYVIPDTGGYGNKLIQIISAFTVALITDSAVIINVTDIGKYVDEPLFDCFQTEQNVSNVLNYLHEPNQTFWMPKSSLISWLPEKRIADLYMQVPTNKTRFIFDGMCSLFFELACNRSYYDKFLYYGLVKPETIQKARDTWSRLDKLDLKKLNKSMNNEAIDALYRPGFELASNIMNIFWKPNQHVLEVIEKFQKTHFSGYYVIGMQFRFENMHWNETQLFWECAYYIEAINNPERPVRWYISTDRPENVDKLVKTHPGKIIHGEGRIAHVAGDPSGYIRVFLDTELMSRCDELIVSGGSTFGLASKASLIDCLVKFNV